MNAFLSQLTVTSQYTTAEAQTGGSAINFAIAITKKKLRSPMSKPNSRRGMISFAIAVVHLDLR